MANKTNETFEDRAKRIQPKKSKKVLAKMEGVKVNGEDYWEWEIKDINRLIKERDGKPNGTDKQIKQAISRSRNRHKKNEEAKAVEKAQAKVYREVAKAKKGGATDEEVQSIKAQMPKDPEVEQRRKEQAIRRVDPKRGRIDLRPSRYQPILPTLSIPYFRPKRAFPTRKKGKDGKMGEHAVPDWDKMGCGCVS
jgi:hypothetical protein